MQPFHADIIISLEKKGVLFLNLVEHILRPGKIPMQYGRSFFIAETLTPLRPKNGMSVPDEVWRNARPASWLYPGARVRVTNAGRVYPFYKKMAEWFGHGDILLEEADHIPELSRKSDIKGTVLDFEQHGRIRVDVVCCLQLDNGPKILIGADGLEPLHYSIKEDNNLESCGKEGIL